MNKAAIVGLLILIVALVAYVVLTTQEDEHQVSTNALNSQTSINDASPISAPSPNLETAKSEPASAENLEPNLVQEKVKPRERVNPDGFHRVRMLTKEERHNLDNENKDYDFIVNREYSNYSIDDLRVMHENGDPKATVAYAHRLMFKGYGYDRNSEERTQEIEQAIVLFNTVRKDYPMAYQQISRSYLALEQPKKAAAYLLLGFDENESCYSCIEGELFIQRKLGEQGFYDLLNSIVDDWRDHL